MKNVGEIALNNFHVILSAYIKRLQLQGPGPFHRMRGLSNHPNVSHPFTKMRSIIKREARALRPNPIDVTKVA